MGVAVLSLPYIFVLTGPYITIVTIFVVVVLILRGIRYMDILGKEYDVNGPKLSLVFKRMVGNWSRYGIDIFTAIS